MKNQKSKILLRFTLVLFILLAFACFLVTVFYIPARAAWVYGAPASSLSFPQRIQYSALLLWYDGMLTNPLNRNGTEQTFTVETGESVNSIASRLEVVELIHNVEAFRAYLIYAGLDTTIQSGEYKLSPAMSTIEI